MRELRLERMPSPDIARAIADGYTTVIVACGAVEQHGPHLPLFTDAEHGDRLALEIARRAGRALVAPTIRVGCSEHHMAFAGTVSLGPETFLSICREYCASLARHGFRRILFVPTHGGNFAPLSEGLQSLRVAAGSGCEVAAYTDLMEVIGVWREVAQRESGRGDRVGGHADLAETSIMLALHPALVRENRAAPGYLPAPDEHASLLERFMREGFDAVTPNGIVGDARGATGELGEKMIAALAETVLGRLTADARPDDPDGKPGREEYG